MPPWDAVRGFGEFRYDAGLTLVELERIVQWVEGGAPKGNDAYLDDVPLETPAPAEPRVSKGFVARGTYHVRKALTVYAVEPRVQDGADLQVIARNTDGAQHTLLWIPKYRKRWHRTYWLRDPIKLAAGSEIVAGGGDVFIATARSVD
jgi:hypothetical protein